MKTLTLRLPERLIAAIESEARERCLTKSEVVRDRLERAQAAPGASDRWPSIRAILEVGWAATPKGPRVWRNPHKQRIADAIRAHKQRHR